MSTIVTDQQAKEILNEMGELAGTPNSLELPTEHGFRTGIIFPKHLAKFKDFTDCGIERIGKNRIRFAFNKVANFNS